MGAASLPLLCVPIALPLICTPPSSLPQPPLVCKIEKDLVLEITGKGLTG